VASLIIARVNCITSGSQISLPSSWPRTYRLIPWRAIQTMSVPSWERVSSPEVGKTLFFGGFFCENSEVHVCYLIMCRILHNWCWGFVMLLCVCHQFRYEEDAEKAVNDLNNRWFNGHPIHAELSPVTDFREACCRQYEMGYVWKLVTDASVKQSHLPFDPLFSHRDVTSARVSVGITTRHCLPLLAHDGRAINRSANLEMGHHEI